jgi:phosphoglycolate phosphatase/pyrophosphatase PpaX
MELPLRLSRFYLRFMPWFFHIVPLSLIIIFMNKVRCLILDHDDTLVNSSKEIHYPAFLETLSILRPGLELSFEEFMAYNFQPGFLAMCEDIFHFTPKELQLELEIWRKWTSTHIPELLCGLKEILTRFVNKGGILCVVSLSYRDTIERDYRHHFDFLPQAIYGWELPKDKRKPSSFAVDEILLRFSLAPEECLVVDDGFAGYKMAKAAKVPFAANCYIPQSQTILDFFRSNADYLLYQPEDLAKLLF